MNRAFPRRRVARREGAGPPDYGLVARAEGHMWGRDRLHGHLQEGRAAACGPGELHCSCHQHHDGVRTCPKVGMAGAIWHHHNLVGQACRIRVLPLLASTPAPRGKTARSTSSRANKHHLRLLDQHAPGSRSRPRFRPRSRSRCARCKTGRPYPAAGRSWSRGPAGRASAALAAGSPARWCRSPRRSRAGQPVGMRGAEWG